MSTTLSDKKHGVGTTTTDLEASKHDGKVEAPMRAGDEYTVNDVASEEHQIDEKKLTWVQATLLLLTEYVVLAILAFPSSYAILGMAGGVLATLIIGLATYYTSRVLWLYCMARPQIRDICDAAFELTNGKRWAWWAAFVGLALNNWAIMGLHVNAGATAIQTIRGGKECTLVWSIAIGVIMFVFSLFREFKYMSLLGILAASTMFVCTILVLAGHGVQGTPNGWAPGTSLTYTVWAPETTTFVSAMSAILNITYTWVGQALIPSFVGDMAHPEDFGKALAISMIAEFCLFTISGAVVYYYAGTALTTAPAYGSLIEKYGKVAAGFTLPTIIIVGILYSLVTSRAIFFQVYRPGSVHRVRHTVQGWGTWIVIVFLGWVISFIIGTSIPFFNDLLSLISSLFDSWFGFIFWGFAWFQLRRDKGQRLSGPLGIAEAVWNTLLIITGVFFFVAGTYTSAQGIKNSYAAGAVKTPFTCANTGFVFTR